MEVVMLRQKLETATRGSDKTRLRDVIRQAQQVPIDDYIMRRANRRLEILQIKDGEVDFQRETYSNFIVTTDRAGRSEGGE